MDMDNRKTVHIDPSDSEPSGQEGVEVGVEALQQISPGSGSLVESNNNVTSGGAYYGVPKGWFGCPPLADSIIVGKFLVFKTPLSKEFNGNIKEGKRFPPEAVFDYVKAKNKRIGLWIDLTNPTRYYPSSLVEAEGIEYFKLKCPGFGTVPSEVEIERFMSAVNSYKEKQPAGDESLIAVHCTHGLNRTGFFICTYLTLHCGYPIRAAIQEFTKCRPPGICRQVLVDYLMQTHSDIAALAENLPPLIANSPDWLEKTSEEFYEEEAAAAAEAELKKKTNQELGQEEPIPA